MQEQKRKRGSSFPKLYIGSENMIVGFWFVWCFSHNIFVGFVILLEVTFWQEKQ